jgi:hypothetical protein
MNTATIATRSPTQHRHHPTTTVRCQHTNTTARSHWIDAFSGERLSRTQLDELRRKAHVLYAANTHIFEDERDALGALGALPAELSE